MPEAPCATAQLKALWETYKTFFAAFREAAERWRAGDRDAAFPIGSFPPGLPWWPEAGDRPPAWPPGCSRDWAPSSRDFADLGGGPGRIFLEAELRDVGVDVLALVRGAAHRAWRDIPGIAGVALGDAAIVVRPGHLAADLLSCASGHGGKDESCEDNHENG